MTQEFTDRKKAFSLLTEYVKSEHLLKHALMVEAVMRHFAGLFGEDEELWGTVGLVHDLDYERYPSEHCAKTKEILTERGWPQNIIRAVESHGYGFVNHVKPLSNMEKTLYAVDELTGLIAATALMRPSKSLMDLETSSVKKKWKQKSFAAGVNREVIERAAEDLGMELNKLITETIAGMRTVSADIGLDGSAAQK